MGDEQREPETFGAAVCEAQVSSVEDDADSAAVTAASATFDIRG